MYWLTGKIFGEIMQRMMNSKNLHMRIWSRKEFSKILNHNLPLDGQLDVDLKFKDRDESA